jgi:hypothetical protein
VAKKAKKSRDTELEEIQKHIKMSPGERQDMSRQLKEQLFGKNIPDVRDW